MKQTLTPKLIIIAVFQIVLAAAFVLRAAGNQEVDKSSAANASEVKVEESSASLRTDERLKADFTASPTEGATELTVGFTDKSTGIIVDWLWNFGDDITSTVQNPLHIYTREGSFPVSLTVTDANSNIDTNTKEAYIKVTSAFTGRDDMKRPFAASDEGSSSVPVQVKDKGLTEDSSAAVLDAEWAKKRLLHVPPVIDR